MKAKPKTDFRSLKGGIDERRLTIAHCRKVLKEEAEGLSDEEIIEIRDYFYRLASIAMEDYQDEKQTEAPVINLEHYKTTQDEKNSHYLRAS
jgi:hypothetical protein